MLDIIACIDNTPISSLLAAEKRSLGIIKSRIDCRQRLGEEVLQNDADMFRKRLFLSRIDDLKSLSGIRRHLHKESDFIKTVSRVRPQNILLELPPEFKGRKGIEIDIDMLLQHREKKYNIALRLCDKLERSTLFIRSEELRPDPNEVEVIRAQKERELILQQLQSLEEQLPFIRKKLYKLFFSLEQRTLYSFLKNQMDEALFAEIQNEAENGSSHFDLKLRA